MSDDSAAVAELHAAFKLQSAAFIKDQSPSLETRQGYLAKLAGMMMANRQPIRDALTADFGVHAEGMSDIIETLGVAGRAMFVHKSIEGWMKDDPRETDPQFHGNGTAAIRYEPKGVIGNLSPFNFPYDLTVGPLCDMLGAGNRVIIKPSEFTPACGKQLKEMLNATFPKDLVDVVLGGSALGIEFSKVKWNHLLYTGSPAVGKLVMAEAAKNLVPVTLELGGKSPVIVLPGGSSAKTLEAIIGTKMLKNGQMCVSTDYIYVHKDEIESFLSLAQAHVKEALGAYSAGPDCCGIITDRHLQRLEALLDEAKTAGTRIVNLEDNIKVDAKRRMPLTLVVDPSAELRLSKEEIFGPLLPILPYTDIEQVLASINAGERPLALYIFGTEEAKIEHIIANTKSGGVSVNCCAIQAALPSMGFGGTGQSGIGRHHGVEGFREFSNPKGIFRRGDQPDLLAALYPPYALAQGVADHAFKEAGM